MAIKYKRVMLKISGEALAGEKGFGLDGATVTSIAAKIKESGYEIEYIDSTIIAQEPKIKPYILNMRDCISKYAGISVEQCNVKATTEEKMGFTGNLEGIAAHAVCLLK